MKLSEETAYFFPGEQIADFQLVRPLRVRELSECWHGFRLESGDPVAIKFLRKENPRIPQFRDVAAFLQRGESPFLIRVLESGETNQGMPFKFPFKNKKKRFSLKEKIFRRRKISSWMKLKKNPSQNRTVPLFPF